MLKDILAVIGAVTVTGLVILAVSMALGILNEFNISYKNNKEDN